MTQETTKPFFIRPHMTITRDGIHQKNLPACRSPIEILAAFNEVEPKDLLDVSQCWHLLKLRRGAFELGSLHDVRQAWHLWKQVMFLWTASQGLEMSKTRSDRRKMMVGDREQHVGGGEDAAGVVAVKQGMDQLSLEDRFDHQASQASGYHLPRPAVLQAVATQPADFQPVSQPFYPTQATLPDNNDGSEESDHSYTSSDDLDQQDQSINPQQSVFSSVYQIEKRFVHGQFRYPWEIEHRPMYDYEYEAMRDGPEPRNSGL